MNNRSRPPESASGSVNDVLSGARGEGRAALSEWDGKQLLRRHGIPTPRAVMVSAVGKAEAIAAELEGLTPPFAVKVLSPAIIHKSDVGGVRVGLPDARAVSLAIAEMASRDGIAGRPVEGWLVEEMAPPGQEVVLGGLRDPQFGPVIMVGLGGVFVEVLKDVAFRVCPIGEQDARAMLAELKGAPLLEGTRGRRPVDLDALIDVMLRFGGEGGLLEAVIDAVSEVDLNPVIVSERGAVAVDARFILGAAMPPAVPPPASLPRGELPVLEQFRPLFEPASVAVLGASSKDVTIANTFIRRLKAFGFAGPIYPIHPAAAEVEGLPAYRDLAATPGPVDYAYVAIAAERIPEALAKANGRLKIAQVISSGFGETEDGKALESELMRTAHAAGVRVIGPNCLGSYVPRGCLTFPADAETEPGTIGIVAQSGGLTTDIIKRGQWRGLRFRGAITIGNSADVAPDELVAYYLEDPDTRAIGVYLEDVKHGRRFFDLLRSAKATKPVVILKGGLSGQGGRAAASHTGALSGDSRIWDGLVRQTGCVLVTTLNEFLDALMALQHVSLDRPRPTERVVLYGNGGGSSVLGADACDRYGLAVPPLAADVIARLEALGLPPGNSLTNPIDTPVRTMQEKDGQITETILDILYEHAEPDAVVMHLNLAAFVGRGTSDPVDTVLALLGRLRTRYRDGGHIVLALRSDGSPELDQRRRELRGRARAIGIATFDEIPDAVRALAAVAHLERQRLARSGGKA